MATAGIALNIVAGSLTTLSPCVFPVLPLVLGGAVQRNRLAPLAMGLGMVTAFTAMGVLVGTFGSSLNVNAGDARYVGAALLLIFGLMMLFAKTDTLIKGALAPLANLANVAATKVEGDSLGRSLLLGALLGVIWSPCSGPLLGAALTLVATQGSATQGALNLGLFGLGAATPLVLVAYASRSGLQRARHAVMRHGDKARLITGVLMASLGVFVLTGADKALEASLTAMLPDAWVQLITSY